MGARRKLFAAQEAQVLELYKAGASQTEISVQFGVSQSVVSQIIRKAGISRTSGPRSASLTITPVALTPFTVSPEVLSLRDIANDETLAADVRLLAVQKLRTIEAQAQARVQDDKDDIDPFATCACRRWTCVCPTKPVPQAKPVPAPTWEPDAEAASVIAWAEDQLEGE
jgi:transposase-like protein